MPNPYKPSEIMAAYRQDREDELLDAVLTAGALVAWADGRVEPVERGQLLDFLDRNEFLSVFTYGHIRDAFERHVRALREPGGTTAALHRLTPHGGRSLARLVVDAGEEVAAADCLLDPREQQVLQIIRTSLRLPVSPAARNLPRLGQSR